MSLIYAPRARQDIADIYDAVAAHSSVSAQRVEDVIRTNCERIGAFPNSAEATDEPGLRPLPLVRYPYTIFYRVDPQRDVVEIVRVIHSARIKDLGQLPED